MVTNLSRNSRRRQRRLRDFGIGTDEVDLAAEFPGALERGEIVFGFQPIVEATTGETVWAEALMAWVHPRRHVGPGEFLPVAETLGLTPSHEWVYGLIAETAKAWRGIRPDSVVTANSAPVLGSDWSTAIEETLARGLEPDSMAFEVDWDALVGGGELIRHIRSLGFRVGLDDYMPTMSLDQLEGLPVDFVKLDGPTMVLPILEDRDARARVATVVAACARLDRPVVAEYVETFDHAAALVEAGCTLMQGGAYGWPLASDAFLASTANRAAPIRR